MIKAFAELAGTDGRRYYYSIIWASFSNTSSNRKRNWRLDSC